MPVTKLLIDPDQKYREDRNDHFDEIHRCANETFATETRPDEYNRMGFMKCLTDGADIFQWRFKMLKINGLIYKDLILDAYVMFVKDSRDWSRLKPQETPGTRLAWYTRYSYCTGVEAPSPKVKLFNDFNK
jgi:hypothetical protein